MTTGPVDDYELRALIDRARLDDRPLSVRALTELQSLRSAQPADGWRYDMENAPKSGCAILLDPKWGVCEGTKFDDGTWGLATFNGTTKKAYPTAWRPLPTPPGTSSREIAMIKCIEIAARREERERCAGIALAAANERGDQWRVAACEIERRIRSLSGREE